MWTFFIALAVLIGGYLVYSRLSEKIFAIDDRKTPAIDHPDGVDIQPLPKWKAFLIELLNIAGTGPIFGAISGALFGPIVFVWIVLGCILGGAVHDYFSGMISVRNNGDSIPHISRKYGGRIVNIFLRIFSIVLLILVPNSANELTTELNADILIDAILLANSTIAAPTIGIPVVSKLFKVITESLSAFAWSRILISILISF